MQDQAVAACLTIWREDKGEKPPSKVADMECLPENLRGRVYYHPTSEGIEKRIRERLEEIKRLRLGKQNPREKES